MILDKAFFGNKNYTILVLNYLKDYFNLGADQYVLNSNADRALRTIVSESPLFLSKGHYHHYNGAEWEKVVARIRERLEGWDIIDNNGIWGLGVWTSTKVSFVNGVNIQFKFLAKTNEIEMEVDVDSNSRHGVCQIISTMAKYYNKHQEEFDLWFNKLITEEQKIEIMEKFVQDPTQYGSIRNHIRS